MAPRAEQRSVKHSDSIKLWGPLEVSVEDDSPDLKDSESCSLPLIPRLDPQAKHGVLSIGYLPTPVVTRPAMEQPRPGCCSWGTFSSTVSSAVP